MMMAAKRIPLPRTWCAIGLLAVAGSARAGLLDDFGLSSKVVREETKYTCTPLPPPRPPAQFSSAEGIPPLPLPAVPLRRTEKKNPPRPPVLIAKIATRRRSDWATNPSDTRNLLRWMAKNLNVHFSSINTPQARVPADPKAAPVLYRTGHDAFSFSPQLRARLRNYLLHGGTLIFDACCGRHAFFESALRETEKLIPERPPYRLTLDHPLYHSYFDIKHIRYRHWALLAGARNDEPSCIGVDVECRTAIFLFRWDVSCGWDGLADSKHHHCLGYTIETARKLGANLMAYITAERSAALPLSKALDFVDADKGDNPGKLAIAQVKYTGEWRTRDAALPMLLNAFNDQTKAPVRFHTETVTLDSPRLFDMPFIYLTGHQPFVLSPQERAGLRQYLLRGGVLLAESCCGREAFDRSFRREIRLVLNGQRLEKIPESHPLYLYPNRVTAVQPRPALARVLHAKGKVQPDLYGASVNGHLAVIYAPYGLACGWELAQCPYCHGIAPTDALALGVNILSYALMQ